MKCKSGRSDCHEEVVVFARQRAAEDAAGLLSRDSVNAIEGWRDRQEEGYKSE